MLEAVGQTAVHTDEVRQEDQELAADTHQQRGTAAFVHDYVRDKVLVRS